MLKILAEGMFSLDFTFSKSHFFMYNCPSAWATVWLVVDVALR